MTNAAIQVPGANPTPPPNHPALLERAGSQITAFGHPRDFLSNHFVYLTVSARARGLSVGINVNPDQHCNFDCVYCEVDRRPGLARPPLDVATMAQELQTTLRLILSGEIRGRPGYHDLPAELLELRHVALSGDGEPTLSPQFSGVLESVVQLRAAGAMPFFKIVLLTNATGLDTPSVRKSLRLLTDTDEVWAKLDAGTQEYMDRVNHPQVPLSQVTANILALARQRPVIIQSLFLSVNGEAPTPREIEQYLERLKELKAGGALIQLVQVYSPTRPMARRECGHLPLRSLSQIVKLVRSATGLAAEVF